MKLTGQEIKDLCEVIRMVKKGHSEDFIVGCFKKIWEAREQKEKSL